MQIKRSPEDFVVVEQPSKQFLDSGDYFVYKATKRDLTTHELARRLARSNGLHPKQVRYAGAKDRRAVTTQYLTSPRKLSIDDERIGLEHVGFADDHLSLGELSANDFEITVYDVQEVRDVEIPNYFGDQRFSSENRELGLLLLKGDFLSVAQRVRGQFRGVDDLLDEKPNDAVSALRKAPMKILLLYVHSVQSWLYNEAVSAWVADTYDEYAEASYSLGTLRFPYADLPDKQVPLVGAVNDLGEWMRYYQPLLEQAGIGQHSFMIRSFKQLTQEGVDRSLAADVRKKEVVLDGSTAQVSLSLGSGCYATVVLEGLLV